MIDSIFLSWTSVVPPGLFFLALTWMFLHSLFNALFGKFL